MNVLIVEDEEKVAKSIKKILFKSGSFNVIDLAGDYRSALNKAQSNVYDIILIDIYLKEDTTTGIDLLKKIRETDKKIPLIMITGFQDIKYLEEAFKYGASDYVKKPFDTKELELRIIRWMQLSDSLSYKKFLTYSELKFDFEKNQFFYKDNPIFLTKKNKILLQLFLDNPESMLSSTFVKEKLWGDYSVDRISRNLRSNIQSLRNALKPYCKNWIKTVRGEGYILKK
jgi:DNA-binding response OmpR family regulator